VKSPNSELIELKLETPAVISLKVELLVTLILKKVEIPEVRFTLEFSNI
jgi:hypothetical protein